MCLVWDSPVGCWYQLSPQHEASHFHRTEYITPALNYHIIITVNSIDAADNLAFQSSHTPIPIDSDEDEEQSPEHTSLEGAIHSATKTILVNTLLEVCNRNDASKEIVRAMLLPSSVTPGLTDPLQHGTKRRASSSDAIDRICQHCGREFTSSMQFKRDCIYHPGQFRVQP